MVAFGGQIDYATLQKRYGDPEAEKRYSPAKCLGCDVKTVVGEPAPEHINTSYVERQNLTMRMSMRRFTRLTNGFSKKVENHAAAVALYFMYDNFARIHQTLRTSPAQAAGVTEKQWSSKIGRSFPRVPPVNFAPAPALEIIGSLLCPPHVA